jgi:hypothetical protein
MLRNRERGTGMTGYCVRKPSAAVALLLLFAGPVVAQWPPDENPQFFPSGVFVSNRSILARGYSWFLRSMQEKPLAECVSRECPQVYRVLIETRPYNAPVVVRLWIRSDGVSELVTKVGRDGGHPQILSVSKTADPSRVDVDKFLKLLEEAGFWSMPTEFAKPTAMGASGWMLEGMRGDKYHLVCRSAPELGPLKDPLDFLVVGLAKLDLKSLPVGPRGLR